MPLWLAADPLMLASKSASRRSVLESAGIPIDIEPADVDERAIEERAGLDNPEGVAALLAREKAKAISIKHPDRIILGADQTLALGKRRFSKAPNRAVAREQVAALRGNTHTLHSALAVMRGGAVLFETVDAAHL